MLRIARMSASSLWSITETDFPANGSLPQRLGFALKYAALAPTEFHWQPWEFRLADAHLELWAQPAPVLAAVDPEGRELLIGCGAALQYLKLALKHFGCLGRVELFPDLDQPALLARVHFGFSRERDAREKLLFEAITSNRPNASAIGEMPVSETMLAVIGQSVAGERGWLEFAQSETSRQRVAEIAAGELATSDMRARAFPPTVPTGGPTARWPRPLFAFGGRKGDSQQLPVKPTQPVVLPAATLGVVKTKTDDKHGWLAAGQTMARAILQAQALGLAWSFFNPVRRREAREALRTGIGHKGFAQVILRFGALTAAETVRMAAPQTETATFR